MELTVGEMSRSLSFPHRGKVTVVSREGVLGTDPERLKLAFTMEKKKEVTEYYTKLAKEETGHPNANIPHYIHKTGPTLIDLLEKLPNIPVPFGLVIGNGGLNARQAIKGKRKEFF